MYYTTIRNMHVSFLVDYHVCHTSSAHLDKLSDGWTMLLKLLYEFNIRVRVTPTYAVLQAPLHQVLTLLPAISSFFSTFSTICNTMWLEIRCHLRSTTKNATQVCSRRTIESERISIPLEYKQDEPIQKEPLSCARRWAWQQPSVPRSGNCNQICNCDHESRGEKDNWKVRD